MSEGENAELFRSLLANSEQCRWRMDEVPWERFEAAAVSSDLIDYVQRTVLSEATTRDATRRFMDEFTDDSAFLQWIAVWFYEETKHPSVLQQWLANFGAEVAASELAAAQESAPFIGSRVTMLGMNVIAELMASHAYLELHHQSPEPTLAWIALALAKDESRHAGAFFRFTRREMARARHPDRERRKLMLLLYLWLKKPGRIKHPGLMATHAVMSATNGDDDMVGRLCRTFAILADAPTLRRPDDLHTLLGRDAA